MSIIKKIFFFSLFILFISILFWGVYIISFRKNVEIPKEIKNLNETNYSENIINKIKTSENKGKIYMVSDNPVLSAIVSPDNKNLIYFSKNSHKLVKSDFEGNGEISISNKSFPGTIELFWSTNKNKILIKTKNESGTYKNYSYDIREDSLKELNNNIYNFSWQTNADRVIYEYKNQNTKTLNISDPDGENWIKLIDLPFLKTKFSQIPKTGNISFWNDSDAYIQTKFQTIPVVGGEPRTIFEDGFGADYLWSQSGNYVLISKSNEKGGTSIQLAIMNYNGDEYKNLGIPTFVSKCVWSKNEEYIFYALPGEIPDNSILPNDYKEEKFQTADTFWKINLKTGTKERIIEIKDIEDRYDATNLFLNQDESALFFTNKIDGKLYKITL